MNIIMQIASVLVSLMGSAWHQEPLNSLIALSASDERLEYRVKLSTTKLVIAVGDVTTESVDAIVNPANVYLANFGGVALAIDTAAGPHLKECIDHLPKNAQGKYLEIGQALTTDAFNLHAVGIKHIIHAVGPDTRVPAQDVQKEQLLAATYTAILDEAKKTESIQSVAVPSISTGIFGYDINQAAPIALSQIITWIKKNPFRLKEVRIVVWPANFQVYKDILQHL